jgi:hypothetical protein
VGLRRSQLIYFAADVLAAKFKVPFLREAKRGRETFRIRADAMISSASVSGCLSLTTHQIVTFGGSIRLKAFYRNIWR